MRIRPSQTAELASLRDPARLEWKGEKAEGKAERGGARREEGRAAASNPARLALPIST